MGGRKWVIIIGGEKEGKMKAVMGITVVEEQVMGGEKAINTDWEMKVMKTDNEKRVMTFRGEE